VRQAAALVAALALGAAGCGGDGNDEAATDLLERGFATDVESGVLTLDAEADLEGVEGLDGPLRMELEGPFRAAGGPTELPDADLDVSVSAGPLSFDGRLVVTAENAWVEFRGETYEAGQELWARARDALESDDDAARSFAEAGVDPLEWVEDAQTEGDEEVAGAPTTRVSGTLDTGRMLRDSNDLVPQRDERIPEDAIEAVEESVQEVKFDVWIGDDDIWRRIAAEVEFEVPEDRRDEADGLEGGSVSLDATLADPNEPVTITGPRQARPLSELLRALGIPPPVLLGPGFAVPEPG
jgi:hypothetical protein